MVNGRFGVSSEDLSRLCAVIDATGCDQPGEMPSSVLEALRELVPCDDITYQVMDPAHETVLEAQELHGGLPNLEPDGQRLDTLFWQTFWCSPACNYPRVTGDFTGVRRATDFYSAREFAASPVFELFRLQGVRYETLVPLPPDGGIDYRLLLWRVDGPDFSERDQLLLTLLRPHLAELNLARRGRRGSPLTLRQAQLLDLVADGMTNRQIANRLQLSEGTVRRHLENIFQRLGVSSRTAAAAHASRPPDVPRHVVRATALRHRPTRQRPSAQARENARNVPSSAA